MTEYKLIKEVENVVRYAISENEIYIVGKNNFRVINNGELIFSTETEDTFQDVFESINFCLLPYTNSYKTGFYSKSNSKFHTIEGIIGVALDENGDCFFGNKNNKFSKYNLVRNEEVWSINSRLFNFYQNESSIFGMLQGGKTNLYSFSKEAGQVNWEYDFSKIGALSFSLIIGEKDDVLFIPIKNGRNEDRIVGLDMHSGKLVFQSSKEIEGDKVGFDRLPRIYNWSFTGNNKIIGICDYWIYSVNILTGRVILFDKKEHLSDNNIGKLNSAYKISENEQSLFLIGYEKMKYNIEEFKRTSFVVALNKDTMDVEWKCPVKNGEREGPRFNGEKVFVRNSEEQLLIFEKSQ